MDNVIVITGASSGIGKATTQLFAERNWNVIAVARDKGKLKALQNECKGKVSVRSVDVTSLEQVEELFEFVKSEFGRLDVLVNNAGTAQDNSIYDMSVDKWEKTMKVNLRGPFLCTQQAVRMMKPVKKGRIINVGSVRSVWVETGNCGAYNASKFGLRAFTETVAREVKDDGIAVSIICPGITNTPLTNPENNQDTSWWLRPETVAEGVWFMCSVPENVNVFQVVLFGTKQNVW